MPKQPSGRGRTVRRGPRGRSSSSPKYYGLSTSVTISSGRGRGSRGNTRTVRVGDLTKMPREEAEKYFRDPDLVLAVLAEADRKCREAGRRAEQAKEAEYSRMASSSSSTDVPTAGAETVKQEGKPLVINARPVGPIILSTKVKTEPDVAV